MQNPTIQQVNVNIQKRGVTQANELTAYSTHKRKNVMDRYNNNFASFYAERHGLTILQLECNGKRRLCSGLSEQLFNDETNSYIEASEPLKTRDEINKAWEENPQCNIGIVCDGLTVLDISKNGFAWLVDILGQETFLPDTLEAETPSGATHFYYRNENHLTIPSIYNPLISVFAGSNSYVVAPPSTFYDGTMWQWVTGHSPFDCQIAPIDETVLKIIEALQRGE